MDYMTCTRCGLTIRLRAPYLTVEHCPRCIARAGLVRPMQLTEGPYNWGERDRKRVEEANSHTSLPESLGNRTTSTSP